MKIITVNLPESYLKAIETLVGGNGIYPSRCELVRVAVREFLIKNIDHAKTFEKYHISEKIQLDNKPQDRKFPKIKQSGIVRTDISTLPASIQSVIPMRGK